MIDIDSFCGKQDVREWLRTPFNLGKETIASNGHILVAVSSLPGHKVLRDKKAVAGVTRMLDLIPEENLFDLPTFKKAKEYDCSACWATGENYIEHGSCGGNGCKDCEYRGEIKTSDPCRFCLGTTKTVALKIGSTDLHLDKKYLDMVKDLPGLKVSINQDNTKLFWRCDEGRGIVMGMNI